MAPNLHPRGDPMNAVLSAALVALLAWWGAIILAGAVSEYRRSRRP